VVGGSGYIGSHAVRALQRHGLEPIVYDNLSTGFSGLARGAELIVGDINDRTKLMEVLPRVDAIMHFAAYAYVGESVQNPEKYFQNNVIAALTLLNAAKDCGIRRFVFSSTCAVYGTPVSVPIDESTPRQPINPYGASKLFFEHALEAYHSAYGLLYANLRYFNAAGADESGEIGEMHVPETHLVPLVLGAAAGTAPPLEIFGQDYPTPDGTCIRDYIHVSDLAEAHVRALEYLDTEKRSLAANLGTGRGHSVYEVIAAVERVTGLKVPHKVTSRRPGDPAVLVANASRAEQLLNWKATRSLDDIVSTAWNWMRKRTEYSGVHALATDDRTAV
jgi:UDP-arabinose 4-epimerase